jgi:hypothetical protein
MEIKGIRPENSVYKITFDGEKVVDRNIVRFSTAGYSYIAFFEPIPLTEEILLKACFERFEMSDTEKSYSIELPRNRRLSVIILGENKLIQITSCSVDKPDIPVDFVCLFDEMYDGKLYTHKLQNIVYELTGKELEMKL